MSARANLFLALAVAGLVGCGPSERRAWPIFVDGRAVAYAPDSALALTASGSPVVLLRHVDSAGVDTLGAGVLHSPLQVQRVGDTWFVSDVDGGQPMVVVFGTDGQVRRRIRLAGIVPVPHQFAALPDGRLVIESGGRLVSLGEDSLALFADSVRGPKTGLLVAAGGGVVHALPDRFITYYNGFGRVRWRIDWPWAESAYVTDLAVDLNGRIHLIAGVPSDSTFVVYSLSNATGEVVRWSVPGPRATFVVDYLGTITPDDRRRWLGQ